MHRKKTPIATKLEEFTPRALAIYDEPIQDIDLGPIQDIDLEPFQNIDLEPIQEIAFDVADLECDFSNIPTPLPSTPSPRPVAHTGFTTGTLKVSIRIPARVLAAFKARAATTGTAYQSLMNRSLNATVLGWGSV